MPNLCGIDAMPCRRPPRWQEIVNCCGNSTPILPQRVRQVPKQFSWLDHRIVSDHHIEQCTHPASALYLFLVTVSDAQGLSWWSERSLAARLDMAVDRVREARTELEAADLVAYEHPVWQVLALKGGV